MRSYYIGLALVVVAASSCSSTTRFRVPYGRAIELDGTLGHEEWSDAVAVRMANGGDVMLKCDGTYLYLGIRGVEMGWSHVCVASRSRVLVLHSSAALGTAVYSASASGVWQPIRHFNWTLRDTSAAENARKARTRFLEANGWVASTAWMGTFFEREYVLDRTLFGEQSPAIAVLYASDEESPDFYYWPTELSDDSLDLDLACGRTPESLRFNCDTWMLLGFPACHDPCSSLRGRSLRAKFVTRRQTSAGTSEVRYSSGDRTGVVDTAF